MFAEISSTTWNAVAELTVIYMEIHVWLFTSMNKL